MKEWLATVEANPLNPALRRVIEDLLHRFEGQLLVLHEIPAVAAAPATQVAMRRNGDRKLAGPWTDRGRSALGDRVPDPSLFRTDALRGHEQARMRFQEWPKPTGQPDLSQNADPVQ